MNNRLVLTVTLYELVDTASLTIEIRQSYLPVDLLGPALEAEEDEENDNFNIDTNVHCTFFAAL